MLVLVLLLFGFSVIGLEGCGGENGGEAVEVGAGEWGRESGGGTPLGTYTVTVTSTVSGLSHATMLTLVVK